MATAYSGEVSIGTYNRIRIKCDYSGTSATCTVQFRRTQAYSGYWGDSRATLTFNGTTKGAGYSYSGTAGTSWINLVTVSGYSVSTSGGTYNWNFSNPGSGVLGCSGTIVIGSQGTAPSQLAISLVEAAWNSVTFETTVGDWGTGTSYKRAAYLLEVPYVAGVDKYHADSYDNTTQPVLMNVGTHSAFEFSNNPFVVYGCKEYYTGLFASTTAGEARLQGPTFYTAPCKLDSLTYASETFDGSTITATIAAKTNSTWNKSGATVGFLYQVSTDGGETFDGWKDLSTTATVGTTASLSIPNLQPGTAYVVEVAQICMDADIKYSSESSFVNFTTKKYRKTYGPGASGYVTSTFEDDAKHTVENTADHTLLGYSLLGKTEQDSYSGVQMLTESGMATPTNDSAFWNSTSGSTITSMLDGWCKIECTSAQFDNFMLAKTAINGIAVGKVYTFIFEFRNVNGLDGFTLTQLRTGECFDSFQIVSYPDGRTGNAADLTNIQNGTYVLKNTVARDGTVSLRMFTSKDAGKSLEMRLTVLNGDHSSDWQNYCGDKWQPYTGGVASPSPDWPQTVRTATGRQTVIINGDNGSEQSYEINLGKNLFNYATDTTGKYIDGYGVIQSNGGFQLSDYIAVEPGEYYSYRGADPYPTWGAKFGYFDGNKTWVGSHDIHNGMYSFIVPNGVRYMRLSVTNTSVSEFQFEKGTEPSSYSPYFTPIELNYLGNYQDKIYPNNGKWYVHKETDKITVVPNDLSGLSTHSGSFVTVNLVKSGIMQNSSAIVTTASENFVGATMTQTWNNQVSNSVSQATNGHYLQFCLPNSAGTTLDAVKTYFTNHPTDVRYVLTTATDTEITYAPLIEQLETLRKLGHTSVDATTFDRNGYGNATVGLEVKTANASSLPVGFTPLEYIESDGNQWISNSGIIVTLQDRLEVTADWSYGATGSTNQPNPGRTIIDLRNLNNGNIVIQAGTTGNTFSSVPQGKHTYFVDYMTSKVGYDNVSQTMAGTPTPAVRQLAIGAWEEGYSYYYKAIGKLYGFKTMNMWGVTHDLVPVKTIDNKVGLYDKVTKKFYPSSTATAFTAGPVDSTLVTKQFRKLYGAKPAKKNLLDVPLNFTITSSDRYKTVPITLESGKTYTYSVQGITTDSATEFLMLPINGSTAVGDGVKLTPTTKSMTFTMPGGADRVYIYSSKNWADSGSHTTTYHGVMIEEGSEATTYQAYSNGGKAGKAKKIKKLYGPAPAQVNLIHVGPLTQITHTQTSNGLVSTKKRLTCEEVNVSGTSTSNWSNFGPQYSVNWPAGTYTLTVDHPLPFDVVLRTTGAGDKILAKGKTSYTFTTTATATAYYFFNDNYSSGTTFNETFKIQLVKGSTPDYDFKLYSDGTNANTTKLIYND